MISDRENEVKIKQFAEKNRYTILANTLGTLEYVKYCYEVQRATNFLKWPKGSDSVIIVTDGISKKIKIKNLK